MVVAPADSPLSFTRAGAGPLIVLCHGVTDSAAALFDLALRLSHRYIVVAVDSLGHGLSRRTTPADRQDPMASALKALEATLDPLVLDYGPAVGIGHSMGGALLTRLAAKRPDLFAGVIAEDPSWLSPVQADDYLRNIARNLEYHEQIRRDPAGTLERNRAEYPDWPEAERPGWLAGKLQVDLNFLATGEVGYTDWRKFARKLSVPTLIVTGDSDDVVLNHTGLEAINELGNNNIETRLIEGARHCVRRENADAFQILVDDFLNHVHPPLMPDKLGKVGGLPTGGDFDANVEARVWQPSANPESVVLAIHGGGSLAGRATYERNSELATLLNAVVVSPEYRLTPERPFSVHALDFLTAARYSIDTWPDLPLFIYGDSAGCGLAETTAALAFDSVLEAPAGLIMIEPSLNSLIAEQSIRTHHGTQMWNRDETHHGPDAYLQGAHPHELPRLIDHKDADHQPRVLTVVASEDPHRDEGITWTTGLVDAGFNAQLHMIHGAHDAGLSVPGTRAWEKIKALIKDFVEDK